MSTSKMVYSKDLAVFQNRILDLYKGMSLDEKRLLVLLSPLVRTTKIKESESVFLSANEYARQCGISSTRAYEGLSDASQKLVRRYFSYTTNEGKNTVANWILRSTYDEGGIEVFFTKEVLTMLQVFDKLNPYTKYKKDIILKLKGDYAFEIYHIAKQFEGLEKADIPIDDLKTKLDVPKSYHDLSNFKKRVLDPSCSEISNNTDLNLTYETVKRGRSVIAIRFIIKNKSAKKIVKKTISKDGFQDKNTSQHDVNKLRKLSPSQINMIAKKLSLDSEFGSVHIYPGESYEAAVERLRNELTNPKYIEKYLEYIMKVVLVQGFRPMI